MARFLRTRKRDFRLQKGLSGPSDRLDEDLVNTSVYSRLGMEEHCSCKETVSGRLMVRCFLAKGSDIDTKIGVEPASPLNVVLIWEGYTFVNTTHPEEYHLLGYDAV
jgi:hypothetical protein